MSEFTTGRDPAAQLPIEDVGQLIQYIASGAKPEADWRVGTEYEKVGVLQENGLAAPFSGKRGIEAVLERLADRFGWVPKRERGRIIALTGRDANITVEPGGQLELSGEQCSSIHCAHQELIEHIKEIVAMQQSYAKVSGAFENLSAAELVEEEWKKRSMARLPQPTTLEEAMTLRLG